MKNFLVGYSSDGKKIDADMLQFAKEIKASNCDIAKRRYLKGYNFIITPHSLSMYIAIEVDETKRGGQHPISEGDGTTNRPIMKIKFRVGRSEKIHTIYGVWNAEIKNKRMWIYTNHKSGAYFIDNVTALIEATTSTVVKSINETDEDTKKLIHLFKEEE